MIPRWYREEKRKQRLRFRPETSRAKAIRLAREREAIMRENAAWWEASLGLFPAPFREAFLGATAAEKERLSDIAREAAK
jgi:hypothetical protein